MTPATIALLEEIDEDPPRCRLTSKRCGWPMPMFRRKFGRVPADFTTCPAVREVHAPKVSRDHPPPPPPPKEKE